MRIMDGTDGLMFGDSDGEVSPLSASFLYATGAGNWEALLDQLQAEKVEAARFFASPLSPSSSRRGCTRSEAEAFGPVLAQGLLDRKMLGDFCGLCDTGDKALWPGGMDDWRAHTRWLGDLQRAFKNIASKTLANELGHESQHEFTVDELNQLVAEMGTVHCALSAGADVNTDELDSHDEYWPGKVEGCIAIDTHFARGPELAWDNINHGYAELRVIVNKYKRARRNAEPQRCDDGPIQPIGVFPYLNGALGQFHNTWSTLHSSDLRDVKVLQGQSLEDLRNYIAAGRAVPRGRYHYENAGWSGSPVWNAAFVEWGPEKPPTTEDKTVWRAQSFLHIATGQWYLIIYGPDADHPHIEMQNGFAPPEEKDLVHRFGQYAKIYRIFQR